VYHYANVIHPCAVLLSQQVGSGNISGETKDNEIPCLQLRCWSSDHLVKVTIDKYVNIKI
jgi:hypothetical protein